MIWLMLISLYNIDDIVAATGFIMLCGIEVGKNTYF